MRPMNENLPPGCSQRDIDKAAGAIPERPEPSGTGYDPVADEDRAARRKARYAHWAEEMKQKP